MNAADVYAALDRQGDRIRRIEERSLSESTFHGAIPPTIAAVPTGMILDYGGATAPSGYLECNGAAVSRSTYSALFTAISTLWGVGDGSTTFNVPDLRQRYTVGRYDASPDAPAIAETDGNAVGARSYDAHEHGLVGVVFPGDGEHQHTVPVGTFQTGGGSAHGHILPGGTDVAAGSGYDVRTDEDYTHFHAIPQLTTTLGEGAHTHDLSSQVTDTAQLGWAGVMKVVKT